MAKYQGHKNWNTWNVCLWINNDEGLYKLAQDCIRDCDTRDEAAEVVWDNLRDMGQRHTPDGAPYSVTTIRAAMVGM